MLTRLLFLNLVLSCFGYLDLDDECFSPTKVPGKCKLAYNCAASLNAIKTEGFHNLTRCGFRGHTEIVCCIPEKVENSFGDRFASDPATEASATSRDPIVLPPRNQPPQYRPTTTTTTAKPKRRAELECDKIIQSSGPPLSHYIINGQEAAEGEFPYMAELGYSDPSKDKVEFLCGGTLISKRYVMTAAHCLQPQRLRERAAVFVRIGVVVLGNGTYNAATDYKIQEIKIHPDFAARAIKNDIALIKLERDVVFSDVARPGCLYTKPDVPLNDLIVIGFGVTQIETRQFSENLLKATVTFVPKKECAADYDNGRHQIDDNVICAGDKDKHADACQGDSGSSLQSLTGTDGHFRIIGIISYGKGCGTKVPGVYTKVYSYLDWIESIVWS